MTKEELAEQYADETVINNLRASIMDAYQKGYEAAKLVYGKVIELDNVKYIDLGLPSGTCWSCALNHFNYGYHLSLFSFEEAQKMNIPTKEQWEEILKHCRFIDTRYYKKVRILGPNGEQAGFAWSNTSNNYIVKGKVEGCDSGTTKFWVKSEPNSEHFVDVIIHNENGWGLDRHFTGYKLPVFLVKNKTEL